MKTATAYRTAELHRRTAAKRQRLAEVEALLSQPGIGDVARSALTRERRALAAAVVAQMDAEEA